MVQEQEKKLADARELIASISDVHVRRFLMVLKAWNKSVMKCTYWLQNDAVVANLNSHH